MTNLGKLGAICAVVTVSVLIAFAGNKSAKVQQKSNDFSLPRLKVQGGVLTDERGKPVGLFGVNLFESHLGWAIEQDVTEMERNLKAIAACGFNAIRCR